MRFKKDKFRKKRSLFSILILFSFIISVLPGGMGNIKADELSGEEPQETIELVAEVIWTGMPEEMTIPNTTLNLMSGEEVVESIEVTDGSPEVKFIEVDKYNDTGEEILYSISQDPLEDFTTEIRDFIVENTYMESFRDVEEVEPVVEEPLGEEPVEDPEAEEATEEPEVEQAITEESVEEARDDSEDESATKGTEEVEELVSEEVIPEGLVTEILPMDADNLLESEKLIGIDGKLSQGGSDAAIHITLAGSELKEKSFFRSMLVSTMATTNSPSTPGQVTVEKYAVPVPGLVNTWDITLRVEGVDSQKTSDIVLLIDRSGSMRNNQRLVKAKAAAISFVNAMSDKPNTRIAVISFASSHSGATTTQHVGFTSPTTQSNRNTLINAINSLNANGATHTQAGIKRAAELIATSTADFKHMILLSDGEPTQSYAINTINNTSAYVAFGGTARADTGNGNSSIRTIDYRTRSNLTAGDFNDNSTVGYGNYSYTYYGSAGSNEYFYSHGNSAIAQAAMYKNSGSDKTLWTIALETSNYGDEVLEDIASPGKAFTAQPDDLNNIFLQIAGSINSAARDIVVIDPMADGFEIPEVINSNITKSQGNTSYANSVLTWNVGDLTQPVSSGSNIKFAWLKYRITINDDILGLPIPGDNLYPTNGNTENGDTRISYKDSNNEIKEKDFPVPEVNPIFLKVKKILLDVDGKVITDPLRTFSIKIASDSTDGDTIYTEYNQTYNLIPSQLITKTDLRLADDYTVSENAPDYDVTIKVNGVVTSGFVVQPPVGTSDSGQEDILVEVTNKEKPLGKLVLKKILLDENNDPIVGDLREFTFNITGPDNYTATRILKGGETKEITGLKYGEYTVVEEDIVNLTAAGFTITSDPSDGKVTLKWDNKEDTVEITNKYVSPKINVMAKKVWQNGNEEDHIAVTLTLYRQIGAGPKTEVTNITPTIAPGSVTAPEFTYTWSNLPKTDKFGNLYIYTVDELAVPDGYEKVISDDGLTVTNKSKVSTLQLLKIGKDEAPLEGAEFDLYRKVDSTTQEAVIFDASGGGEIYGIRIEDDTYLDGRLKTGIDGKTQIVDDLEAGAYFVVERVAPTGYLLHEYPIEFVIDVTVTLNEITIENEVAPMIPATGGMGTWLFSILGAGIMGGALLGFKRFNTKDNGKGDNTMRSRKLFTLLFTMLVLFVFVAPTMAKATENISVAVRTTNVTIHKMELFTPKAGLPRDHDGTLLTPDQLDEALGEGNYAGLEGVTFKYWKVDADDTFDYLNGLDEMQLDDDYDAFQTIATNDDGIVTLPPLNDGYYFFKEASTPEIVTEQIAVPFLLGLPVMKADGRSFIKDLHIYPKNLTVRGAVVLTKMAGEEKLPEVTFDLYKGVPSTGTLRTAGLETNAQGEIIINNLPVGSYYFVETETVSPYLLDKTPIAFTIAANGKVTVEAGLRTGFNGDVKFVTHDNFIEPKVDKSIGASGTDELSADFNEVFDFIIELDLPADITQYTKLEVLDTLDGKLDYEGGLVVEGSTDGTNYTALTSPGYFTATELVGNRILKVAFVPSALKSGTVNFTDIRITFKASINEDAIMGKGILNEAFVDYNNGYVTGTHKSPEVVAFTGGKNFIKVNGENLALVGAEFAVKNEEGKFLMVDPETGAYTWVDTLEETSFRLTSSSNPATLGLFSIKGLKYDLINGTEYYLYETKAPMSTAGYPYNLIESDIKFLVNGGSYYAEPLEVDEATDAPTAVPQEVLNILGPQIPQTGGIGTTLFTLIGGLLMGSALLLNKKRSRA